MATSLGKSGYLKISSVTAVEFRNYTLSQTSDTVEDTVIGDDWKTRKPTLRDWNLSASLFWDPNDPAQSAAATALGTETAVTVELYPAGTATAATYYSGSCIVTELGAAGSHDGLVERSFSVQGNGELSTLTV